ncbi:MAG: hypothetical protein ABIK28_24965, partial [Planctomycetota bacterium]
MAKLHVKRGFTVIFGICIAFSGCVERKEKISINRNGETSITVLFQADNLEELYPGRVPSADQGWELLESTETRPDGKIRYILAADQVFTAGSPLPGSYADPDLPDAPLHLGFPTRLWFETREDGVYCHFRRIYQGRPWALIAALKEIKADDATRDLMKKDPKSLPLSDRETLLKGMIKIELHKKLTFARSAFLSVTPGD